MISQHERRRRLIDNASKDRDSKAWMKILRLADAMVRTLANEQAIHKLDHGNTLKFDWNQRLGRAGKREGNFDANYANSRELKKGLIIIFLYHVCIRE